MNTHDLKHLIVHIGAHKTATTTIQRTLKMNGARLQAAGIHYMARPTRVKFFISGTSSCSADEAKAMLLENVRADSHTLIFSDEDSLRPASISHPSAIYSDIDEMLGRVDAFSEIAQKMTVLFAIRDYASFLPSVYQQEVKRGRIGSSFDDYIAERADLDTISWRPVVQALAQRFGSGLTVWDHRLIKTNPGRLWTAFGVPKKVQERFRFPDAQSNRALSKVGLEVMRGVHGTLGAKPLKELEVFVAKHFRVSEALPAERYFSDDMARSLMERYERDLDALQSVLARHGASFAR